MQYSFDSSSDLNFNVSMLSLHQGKNVQSQLWTSGSLNIFEKVARAAAEDWLLVDSGILKAVYSLTFLSLLDQECSESALICCTSLYLALSLLEGPESSLQILELNVSLLNQEHSESALNFCASLSSSLSVTD